jgi:hypothetical protein
MFDKLAVLRPDTSATIARMSDLARGYPRFSS